MDLTDRINLLQDMVADRDAKISEMREEIKYTVDMNTTLRDQRDAEIRKLIKDVQACQNETEAVKRKNTAMHQLIRDAFNHLEE